MATVSLRERLAHFLRRTGNRICPDEDHELAVRQDGEEIFSVGFTGSFGASWLSALTGLTVWCRHENEWLEL